MAHVIHGPIDVAAVLGAVTAAERGASVVFLGSVRRGPDDGPVAAIVYEAYAAMVEAECHRILGEAHERWPDGRCMLVHRVGEVPVGQPSIAAAAAAPHRAAAFAACRFVIEQAKRRLPVWKKERFDDGRVAWREPERAQST